MVIQNIQQEIDIYIPSLKTGIDFHGLYWHSSANKKNNYHLLKYKFFKDNDIEVIQVFENEWVLQQDIVKSIILSRLNLHKTKPIYARKCEIREVSVADYKSFLSENHLQGYAAAKVKLGLYYKDELVQLMSFSKSRFNKNYDWENIRSSAKINSIIVGGFSKLLKHFRKNYEGSIISYVDVRYFTGAGYIKNGFTVLRHNKPNYFYFKQDTLLLESRNKYQKHKLSKILDSYDAKLSEYENMVNNKYLRIHDAGNLTLTII